MKSERLRRVKMPCEACNGTGWRTVQTYSIRNRAKVKRAWKCRLCKRGTVTRWVTGN